jgi:hypothetical protein
MLSSFRDLLQVSGFIDIPVSFTIFNHHLICNILLQVIMGVAWGQIFRRKGVSGGKHPPNHEANDILSKENTFFCFKTSSYGLYKSIYKTNLIFPLPLSMWEFKKKMKRLIFVVDFLLPRQLPRLPQWKLRHCTDDKH